jgi:hypothetical protein
MNPWLTADTSLVLKNVRLSVAGPRPAVALSADMLALSDHENRLHFFDRLAKEPAAMGPRDWNENGHLHSRERVIV